MHKDHRVHHFNRIRTQVEMTDATSACVILFMSFTATADAMKIATSVVDINVENELIDTQFSCTRYLNTPLCDNYVGLEFPMMTSMDLMTVLTLIFR